MDPSDYLEARNSFIRERISIMIEDGKVSEETAIVEAGRCWEKYRKCFEQSIRNKDHPRNLHTGHDVARSVV